VQIYSSKVSAIETKAQNQIEAIQRQISAVNTNLQAVEGDEDIEKQRKRIKELEAQKSNYDKRKEKDISVARKKLSLVWIMYMRFARRAEVKYV
jgi:formiminotetrahydrofolate cyclodeaminase